MTHGKDRDRLDINFSLKDLLNKPEIGLEGQLENLGDSGISISGRAKYNFPDKKFSYGFDVSHEILGKIEYSKRDGRNFISYQVPEKIKSKKNILLASLTVYGVSSAIFIYIANLIEANPIYALLLSLIPSSLTALGIYKGIKKIESKEYEINFKN